MKKAAGAAFAGLAAAMMHPASSAFGAEKTSPVVHVDSKFDSGRNRHSWRIARTGTCGPGSTPAAAGKVRLDLAARPEQRAPDSAFKGPFELRAVSGSSAAPRPDECGVFLFTVLGAKDGTVYNGGFPRGDWRSELRFKLKTDMTVLSTHFSFGGKNEGYFGLMIPASGVAAVPYVKPGRIAIMKPRTDLEGDNEPLPTGTAAVLTIEYSQAAGTVRVLLNGRPVAFSGKDRHKLDDIRRARLLPQDGAALQLYTEAQLDAGEDSRVELLSFRFTSGSPAP